METLILEIITQQMNDSRELFDFEFSILFTDNLLPQFSKN